MHGRDLVCHNNTTKDTQFAPIEHVILPWHRHNKAQPIRKEFLELQKWVNLLPVISIMLFMLIPRRPQSVEGSCPALTQARAFPTSSSVEARTSPPPSTSPHLASEWSTLIGRGSALIGRGSALIGRELHSVATPALLCHKEPARAFENPYTGGFGTQNIPIGGLVGCFGCPSWFFIT